MPRKILIPARLSGTAFLTSDVSFHGLGRGRLRGRGVDHAFSGTSCIGLDLTSVLGRCRAYEPRLGRRQFFSHVTSAGLFGIPLPASCANGPLHVTELSGGSPPRPAGIAGHVALARLVNTELRIGLPVVSAADTWFQLATLLSFWDLIAAGDYLITGTRPSDARGRAAAARDGTGFGGAGGWGAPGITRGGSVRGPALASLAELGAAVARHAGSRGALAAASALLLLRSGVDSRPETHLRLLLVDFGIPEPVADAPTLVDGGRLTLHADLTLARYRVVFEYEGDEHRLSKTRFRADIRRRELFEAAGWRVIRVTADDLYSDPLAFITRVRAILGARVAS